MCIKQLLTLITEQASSAITILPLDSYAGKVVACNASVMIYQSVVATQFGSEGGIHSVSDEAGITSAHLVGLLNKTVELLDLGVRPLWVFDGPLPPYKAFLCLEKREQRTRSGPFPAAPTESVPPAVSLICKQYSQKRRHQSSVREVEQEFSARHLKPPTSSPALECPDFCCLGESDSEEYANRDLFLFLEGLNRENDEFSIRKALRIAKEMTEDAMLLLSLLGVPIIIAPQEAEAQCAALVAAGRADAVISEDMDSLVFGGKFLLRGVNSKKEPMMEICLEKVLEELNISMVQFIDLAILLGCDYCSNINGIGPQTALKLIREQSSIENVVEWIRENKKKWVIPEDFRYEVAREAFERPEVYTPEDLALSWTSPDEAQLKSFFSVSKGFSLQKVDFGLRKVKKLAGRSNIIVTNSEEEGNDPCPGMYKKQKIIN